MSDPHFISAACRGELCRICNEPATHKVGEEFFFDDPGPPRHNMTAYLCCRDLRWVLGSMCPEYGPKIEEAVLSIRQQLREGKHRFICQMWSKPGGLMGVYSSTENIRCTCGMREIYRVGRKLDQIYDSPDEEN